MSFSREWQRCVFFITIMVAVGAPSIAQQVSTDAWIADFYQLLSEMSSHYANLEWAANERRVNLPKLKSRTEDRLRQSRTEEAAHRAIESFVKGFGDAHIEIRWQSAPKGDSSQRGGSFCERLGYNQQDQGGGIDWSIFPEYKPVEDGDSADFPAGLLQLKQGRNLGVVRIGLFSEHAHPALCEQARNKVAKAEDAECTEACEDDFELVVSDLLTGAWERRLRSLREAGADTILVDITGNGGGTGWVEPAARVLTPIPLQSPRLGFVKHEHWIRQLQERQRDIEADLLHASSADRAILTQAAEVVHNAIGQASNPCDRSLLWSEPVSALHCSQIVTALLYTSGVVPYAKPRTFAPFKSKEFLFNPGRYQYHEGTNRLPVMVLVDGGTASSAEYFAAILQDNKAATIVGQLTVGAGCGYTDGGIPATLKNSGARVRLPDCVRYRADGSDEVSGIIPDVLLPWADRDSRYQQAAKLKRWMESSYSTPKK